MDYSTTKVTPETRPEPKHQPNESQSDAGSSPTIETALEKLSGNGTVGGVYPCPACPTVLSSSRDLTNHLRGHNSPRSTDCSGEEDYCCGVCHKVLSSASSLDRHVLVHSGERPFKCKYCDMAFTTNGNMNRHLRTAHRGGASSPNSCTDSEASSDSERGHLHHLHGHHHPHHRLHHNHHHHRRQNLSPTLKRTNCNAVDEYNNNEPIAVKRNSSGSSPDPERQHHQQGDNRLSPVISKRKCPDYSNDREDPEGQRKRKILLGNSRVETSRTRNSSDTATSTTTTSSSSCSSAILNCPVCEGQDFATSDQLSTHMERHHPDYPTRCDPCDTTFKNHRAMSLHRYMFHVSENSPSAATTARNLRNSIVGFNDLTFVDFSSDKFPTIARAVCEQSLHRPASGEIARFQCAKCLRAFPCRSALEAHELDCGNHPGCAPGQGRTSEEQQQQQQQQQQLQGECSRRDDFFAGLDLQNRSAMNEQREGGKDLADIQSIISVTSGPILQSFPVTPDARLASTPTPTPAPTPTPSVSASLNSSASSGTPSSEYHEEEAQDAFAAEFRKMKLKGEFPCRLCSAVYPNLRALKGHNRAHMGVPAGRPYPCNMCPYNCTDKATLIRHLRSHNGDRPYECAICNYAFTTKANCERHVRNRHGKLTREDIKSVLIYHPSEDPTNEDRTNGSSRVKDDVRKALVYPEESRVRPVAHCSTSEQADREEAAAFQPLELTRRSNSTSTEMLESRGREVKVEEESSEDEEERADDSSLVNDTKRDLAMQVSPMDLKKATVTSVEPEDGPLDLSMDVLDLSKKSKSGTSNGNGHPTISANREKDFYGGGSGSGQLLLTQALLKTGSPGAVPAAATTTTTTPPGTANSLEALYANAHLLYRNFGTFPGTGIIPPYLFNPHVFGQDYSMKDRLQKDLVRGLQLTSGGTLVEPGSGFPAGFAQELQQKQQHHHHRQQQQQQQQQQQKQPQQHQHQDATTSALVRDKLDTGNSSVKMVIKNGVLMPKQKQRRYRTERPFTCEHCSARFTLRSNMERHIKQQHPQHWSQRPRGTHSTRGRPPNHPTMVVQNANSLQTGYPGILPKNPDYKHAISDQVKYAILAQQLKGGNCVAKPEEDSDEELIIDEDNKEPQEQSQSQSQSLLREKLEESSVQEAPERSRRRNSRTNDEEEEDDDDDEEEDEDDEEEDRDDEKGREKRAKLEDEEERMDLASVAELLDNASQQYRQFRPQYLSDEEGLVASTSDCNNSGSDEKSDSVNSGNSANASESTSLAQKKKKKKMKKKKKKKSAYSMAPNRVICPYCERPFPWTSSLRRHILTHTGQKPYQCMHCSLLFTTKSNCDRHLLRKHKTNPNKMRRMRNSSSPEMTSAPTTMAAAAAEATTMPATSLPGANGGTGAGFSMRNVPERPYKCNQCPSSTFSTLGNLKKHRSTKHSSPSKKCKSRSDTPSSEAQNSGPETTSKQNDQSGYESQSSYVSETLENASSAALAKPSNNNNNNNTNNNNNNNANVGNNNNNAHNAPSSAIDTPKSRKTSPRSSPGPTDAPFKCHLCDSGFADRQDCLEHIKINHKRSYEMLVAKGALDMDIDVAEEQPQQQQQSQQPQQQPHPSDGEEKRGRFPDYSNRKVVCAFCMRRFWSAEDLRRHMRTHTGERPFSCDICCRRFTLKHSMLRHRKKHESVDSAMYVGTSGDEESLPVLAQPPTIAPRCQQLQLHQQQQPLSSSSSSTSSSSGTASLRAISSLPTITSVATGDAAPSGLMRFNNPYEKLTTLTGKLTASGSSGSSSGSSGMMLQNNSNDSSNNENTDNDLISNLLGIRDKSFIDRVLQASADDAAKLLGVNRTHD